MDTNHSIFRSAKHFFFGTLFSRATGLIRDMSMAFWFGSAPEIAAFMVAYRLANLFRRLFGEGNLQAGFIPHFETLRAQESKNSFLFYRDTAFSLCLFLSLAIGAIELILWFIAKHLEGSWQEIVQLSMWMAPGLLFICLSSLNSAFLRCQKKYFITAASPAFFNFIWIGSACLAHFFPLAKAVIILSCGVTVAFAIQWLSTAQAAQREWAYYLNWKQWFKPKFFSADWKQLIKPMAVGIIGVGALQFNSALDAIFGLAADVSGPAYLWYAIRIQQLPLALFGIALSGALLPPLSRAMQEKAFDRYQNLLETALKRSAILMIPCTFAMFTLGGVGLNLLFGRGDFSSHDIQQTLLCLWSYSLGVVPSVFVLLFATGFYAQKVYGRPTIASFLAVASNAMLNTLWVFGFHWGPPSIAFATSVSAFLNSAILYFSLSQKLAPSFWLFLIRLSWISALASLLTLWIGEMALGDVTLQLCRGKSVFFTRAFSEQAIHFFSMGLLFIVSFGILARLYGMGQIFHFLKKDTAEEEIQDII